MVFRLVGGGRRDRSAVALAAGSVCWLVSDVGFLLAPHASGVLDAGWMLGAAFLAAAVRDIGRTRSTTPPAARVESRSPGTS